MRAEEIKSGIRRSEVTLVGDGFPDVPQAVK